MKFGELSFGKGHLIWEYVDFNIWISLRTNNIIERLNKEFKRRTMLMEIVGGESACSPSGFYLSDNGITLATNSIGKVRENLPFLKESAWNNFTKKVDTTNSEPYA